MIKEEWGGGISLAGLTLNMLPASMVVIVIIIIHVLVLVASSSLGSVKLNQRHRLPIIWDNYLRSGVKGKISHVNRGARYWKDE